MQKEIGMMTSTFPPFPHSSTLPKWNLLLAEDPNKDLEFDEGLEEDDLEESKPPSRKPLLWILLLLLAVGIAYWSLKPDTTFNTQVRSVDSAEAEARFSVGDRVVVKNEHPVGHTRAPRYARGRTGIVQRDQGVHIFPDTNAMGLGTKPQHCYSVMFEARELWGSRANIRDRVYIDLFDDYLASAA